MSKKKVVSLAEFRQSGPGAEQAIPTRPSGGDSRSRYRSDYSDRGDRRSRPRDEEPRSDGASQWRSSRQDRMDYPDDGPSGRSDYRSSRQSSFGDGRRRFDDSPGFASARREDRSDEVHDWRAARPPRGDDRRGDDREDRRYGGGGGGRRYEGPRGDYDDRPSRLRFGQGSRDEPSSSRRYRDSPSKPPRGEVDHDGEEQEPRPRGPPSSRSRPSQSSQSIQDEGDSSSPFGAAKPVNKTQRLPPVSARSLRKGGQGEEEERPSKSSKPSKLSSKQSKPDDEEEEGESQEKPEPEDEDFPKMKPKSKEQPKPGKEGKEKPKGKQKEKPKGKKEEEPEEQEEQDEEEDTAKKKPGKGKPKPKEAEEEEEEEEEEPKPRIGKNKRIPEEKPKAKGKTVEEEPAEEQNGEEGEQEGEAGEKEPEKEEEEEEEEKPKKPTPKAKEPVKKAAKSEEVEEADEEEEEEEPKKKPVRKAAKEPEEEEEEEEQVKSKKPARKPAKELEEEEEQPKKGPARKGKEPEVSKKTGQSSKQDVRVSKAIPEKKQPKGSEPEKKKEGAKKTQEPNLDRILKTKGNATVTEDDLSQGLAELDLDTASNEAALLRVVSSSIVEKKLSLASYLDVLQEHRPKESSSLLLKTLRSVKTSKSAGYVKDLIEQEELSTNVLEVLGEGKSQQQLDDLLKSQEMQYLRQPPNTKLIKEVSESLSQNKPLDALLKTIKERTGSGPAPSFLAPIVADFAFKKVYADKKKPDVKALDPLIPILKFVLSGNQSAEKGDQIAQTETVIRLQGAWFAAGGDKDSLKPLFQTLHSSNVVSAEAFIAWKENKSDKTPGKPQALLKVSAWVSDIAPKAPEPEEQDEEEEEDGFLQNPNKEFFLK